VVTLDKYYDRRSYDQQVAGSLSSARKYAAVLSRVLSPTSVLDVGCGRGTWLKAFIEQGAKRVVGLDGPWNSQSNMIEAEIEFVECDLENIPSADERFDLALSVEVGEYLTIPASEKLVSALCSASDFVIFGASIVGQGGADHINEQPQSFWARKFFERGYAAFDIFRPQLWGDPDVEEWYQQNTFFFAKKAALSRVMQEHLALCEIVFPAFMDLRHPAITGLKVKLADVGKTLRGRLGRSKAG
jgi:SAM-dependent methyltransferase